MFAAYNTASHAQAGIGSTGVGICTIIFGPLTQMLNEQLGWRATFRGQSSIQLTAILL